MKEKRRKIKGFIKNEKAKKKEESMRVKRRKK